MRERGVCSQICVLLLPNTRVGLAERPTARLHKSLVNWFEICQSQFRKQRGFTFIEVLIALLILTTFAVGFLIALQSISRAVALADARATAECIARTQMEFIKGQNYIDYSEPSHGAYASIEPSGSLETVIEVLVQPLDGTGQPFGESGGVFTQDNGLQKVTVTLYVTTLYRAGPSELRQTSFVLKDFKVDR